MISDMDSEDLNFYVSITTIRKYKPALDILIDSLPKEWKKKYIVIYENEDSYGYYIHEDGHIEVTIKNNIYDYGNWLGICLLIENGILSQDSWFLFIHDTCRFMSDSCVKKTQDIIQFYHSTNTDIVWLSHNGQCNICLIRRMGILYGKRYQNIIAMTKEETVHYEWTPDHELSPKSFDVIQSYIDIPTDLLGKRHVYSDTVERDVLLFPSIDLEKYYVFFYVGIDQHPNLP
jgi:hypothetical protein